MMNDLPILEVRRIEANIIKPIYEELARQLGEEQARAILSAAINRDAVRQGAELAASTDEPNNLKTFSTLTGRWSKGDALTKEPLHTSEERLECSQFFLLFFSVWSRLLDLLFQAFHKHIDFFA